MEASLPADEGLAARARLIGTLLLQISVHSAPHARVSQRTVKLVCVWHDHAALTAHAFKRLLTS